MACACSTSVATQTRWAPAAISEVMVAEARRASTITAQPPAAAAARQPSAPHTTSTVRASLATPARAGAGRSTIRFASAIRAS